MHLLSDHRYSGCPTPELCCHTMLLCSVWSYIQRDHIIIDYEGQGARMSTSSFTQLLSSGCAPAPLSLDIIMTDWALEISYLSCPQAGLDLITAHRSLVPRPKQDYSTASVIVYIALPDLFSGIGIPTAFLSLGTQIAASLDSSTDPFLTFEHSQLSKGHTWGCKSINSFIPVSYLALLPLIPMFLYT